MTTTSMPKAPSVKRSAGKPAAELKPSIMLAYRALEFLEDQGLVHRIRRLNAYVACLHPGEDHAPAFLICRLCNAVAEAAAAPVLAAMQTAATDLGFHIERANVEAIGLCPTCAAQEVAA